MRFIGTNLTRDIERDMFDYGPREYEDYRESRAIVKTEAVELERLNGAVADVLAQFFVDTATWGLGNWERLVQVPTDLGKPIDQRRAVVKSKLRGIGTVTVSLIKNVAESYSNGEVEVVEDASSYTVAIRFVGKLGVPENLADIQQAIRDIIPAHLAVNFEFTYVTYAQLKTQYATYADLKTSGKTYAEILINE